MILIVDDDVAVRTSLGLLLKQAGYATKAVGTPEEALRVVREATPRLVLMDMNYSLATTGELRLHPIWLAVTLIFATERMVTVQGRGRVQMAVAGLVIVEMIYDIFLLAAQARAFWDVAWRTERKW